VLFAWILLFPQYLTRFTPFIVKGLGFSQKGWRDIDPALGVRRHGIAMPCTVAAVGRPRVVNHAIKRHNHGLIVAYAILMPQTDFI
jgi:hypothetical protein